MSTSPLDNQNIKEYVTLLVAEKKFENVDEEVLEQIREDLALRLENIINAAIVANLPAEKFEEFEKLLKSGKGKQISDFCEQNVPNLQQVVTTELTNFRNSYLGID
jgi:ATP phosphoribosyltransferase